MTPAVRLQVSDKDAKPALVARLSSLTMTDSAGGRADTLEMEFDARVGIEAPPAGTILKLWLGYEPKPIFMGSFRISDWSISGPAKTLRVTAAAADFTSAIKAPRMAGHHETTITAIVEKIAKRHKLEALVDAHIGARVIDHIDQQNESDVSFLSRLAKRQGALFKLGAGRLIFSAKGSHSLANGEAKQVVMITPDQVSTWSVRFGARGGYESASAEWIDHNAGKRKRHRTGDAEPHHRDRRLYGSEAEAMAAAESNLADLKRGTRAGEFTAPGMPDMYADARVTLSEFWPDADGEYTATQVTHTLGGGGYTTSVQLEGVV